jgi:hypothetical protein
MDIVEFQDEETGEQTYKETSALSTPRPREEGEAPAGFMKSRMMAFALWSK